MTSTQRSAPNSVRAIHLTTNVLGNCLSSVCIEIGHTRVLCGVRPPQQLVQEYRGSRGRVSCQVVRAPSSGFTVADGAVERDLGLALEGICEQAIVLESIQQLLVEVMVQIVNDDGAVWDAATTAVSMALALGGIEMNDMFTACTAGVMQDGSVLADLTAAEAAEAAALVVFCCPLNLAGTYYCSHRGRCDVSTIKDLVSAAKDAVETRRGPLMKQMKAVAVSH